MTRSAGVLFDRLVDDAAMFPPGNASVEQAVREHLADRDAWFADLIGPLVVRDTQLAEVGAAATAHQTSIEVSVVTSAGAGSLTSLGRRKIDGVRVVAAESALRDLDDLANNARRVAASAAELDDEVVVVFVELPYRPGWEQAAEVVEAAGLFGKIRTGGVEPQQVPSATQLADQLSVLVEADLPFKATAGLHHAVPEVEPEGDGQVVQHGFIPLMLALAALIDGADRAAAAELLGRTDRDQLAAAVAGWDERVAGQVRRRFRSFGCCGVHDPVDDLVALGLVNPR